MDFLNLFRSKKTQLFFVAWKGQQTGPSWKDGCLTLTVPHDASGQEIIDVALYEAKKAANIDTVVLTALNLIR